LRARRHQALSGTQEEEYLAGEESSSAGRSHQSWKRLFARHKDIFS